MGERNIPVYRLKWLPGLLPGDDGSDPPAPFGIGHNRGPALHTGWQMHCWRQAKARAFRPAPPEVALRRMKRAEALGITYRELTAILADTGEYPTSPPPRGPDGRLLSLPPRPRPAISPAGIRPPRK